MNEWLAAKNILAVRLDNMGDIVMLGPALRAVKETSPHARLTLLASPAGTRAAALLPWIDDVITWRSIWQDVGGRLPFDPVRERELIALLAAHETNWLGGLERNSLEYMRGAGVDLAQGYLFGRPVPLSQLDLNNATLSKELVA